MTEIDTHSIPLSLYVHIPWCEKKCPYCDFNSHLAKQAVNEPLYINCLLDDLEQDIHRYQTALRNRVLSSIFIGGGTPSLFSADSFKTLLRGIESMVDFAPDIEITCEANPGSSEVEKFAGFKDAGVNRLSIGIQSFDQQRLSVLGRVHSASDALNAARFAKAAGFDNVNLDLMFGLPEQTLEQSLDDVLRAIKLKPTHLSCYQLTIEPNTLFYHRPPVTPNDELLWEMQCKLQNKLVSAGYQQYEISAYAQPQRRCRHNLNYWQFGDYLGIGAGAHGKLTDPTGAIYRSWKKKHPASFMQTSNDFIGGLETVSAERLPLDFMMNALRLTAGFRLELFAHRTGRPTTDLESILERHQKLGLITTHNGHVMPTDRGKQLIDTMLQDYLPESQSL